MLLDSCFSVLRWGSGADGHWLEIHYAKGFLFPFKPSYQPGEVSHDTSVDNLGKISVRIEAFKLVLTMTFTNIYFTPLSRIYNRNKNLMK